MSAPTALAAVTHTLLRLLSSKLAESDFGMQVKVTADPPNKLIPADPGTNDLRLNLFLYHLLPNAAWRNQAPPGRGPGLSAALAPLALDAYYLLTAVPPGDDSKLEAQHLLGRALAAFHDVPILRRDAIHLDDQPPLDFYGERVRITPHPLTVDEMSKLWSAFQAPYRLSAAIQVSVVLIDSQRPATPAPPILSRGATDGGTDTEAGLESPYPQITSVGPADPPTRARPGGLPVFEAGETVRLTGSQLRAAGRPVTVVLNPAGAGPPIDLVAPAAGPPDRLDVRLQPASAATPLRAGLFAVAVEVQTGDARPQVRTTNELPLLVAPRITSLSPADPVGPGAILTVGVSPTVGPGQRVSLLVGGAALAPTGVVTDRPTLAFDLGPGPWVSGRTYPVRLRVDGVDSFPTSANEPHKYARTVTIL